MTTNDNVFEKERPIFGRVLDISHDPQTIQSARLLADLVEEPITFANIYEVERLAQEICNDMLSIQ